MARIRGLSGVKTSIIIRFLAISLTFSLAPLSFIQEVSAAPISVTQCKLADPFQSNVRLGFPKDPARLSATGVQKVLLMAIDYSDAPTTENATEALKLAFDTDQVNAFYKSVSYGQLSFTFDIHPTVVRMPKTSSNYVGKLGNTYPQPIFVTTIMQDAARAVSGQVNFSTYQAVAILDLARINSWGYWGFAIPDAAPGFATTTGYIKNSTVIGAWEGNNTNLAKGYKTFVLKHELGHLFGFIDLYIIAPGNYFIGQTPGPFDVMNANGPAHEFLAWQRWLQGWITDSNVTCLAFGDPTATMQLRPLGKTSTETQMTVIRVSAQKALVLESRRGTSTDNLSGNDGLLAYEMDLSVFSLSGPIKIIPKNSAAALAALSPDLSDVERYLDATAQTGEYIRYKDILIENKLSNQDGESIQIYKGDAAATRQRELDNIKKTALIAEFNAVKAAKANNTYFESANCVYMGDKQTFQILDEKRVWKDLDVPVKFASDPTCYNASYSKPYVITQMPSRTFYRIKTVSPAKGGEWYSQVVITDAVPLSDKTQADLEITLAKLEDNYLVDSAGCHSKGVTGTLQIERDGTFIDFAAVTDWLPKNCASSVYTVQPYSIARLSSGTKYRFKLQAAGWDRDYFTQVYTKAKTVPELLAEVTQKSTELNALNLTLGKEKAALDAQVSSLTQQIALAKSEIEKSNTAKAALNTELSAIIATLRAEKTELEGSVATLTTQLVTSSAQIKALEEEMAKQRSSFESVSGELITAKSKLEGDVAFLQKANTTLQTKVNSLTKTTITCIKGSTQKKVTAVKPVCPAGYKKKM